MSYLEGLKAAEIAERLDLSVRTVENQLYRSLLYLRKSCSNLFLLIFLFIKNLRVGFTLSCYTLKINV